MYDDGVAGRGDDGGADGRGNGEGDGGGKGDDDGGREGGIDGGGGEGGGGGGEGKGGSEGAGEGVGVGGGNSGHCGPRQKSALIVITASVVLSHRCIVVACVYWRVRIETSASHTSTLAAEAGNVFAQHVKFAQNPLGAFQVAVVLCSVDAVIARAFSKGITGYSALRQYVQEYICSKYYRSIAYIHHTRGSRTSVYMVVS